MRKVEFIDKNHSTTRLLTKEKPIIKNKSEDQFETFLCLPEDENRKGEGGLRTKGYFKKTYEDKPLVSIITVVFNGEAYLEETILSVINQNYDNIEYIVIDGGSTDGTVNIIKKYENQIDYWISEQDDGIYDAMNKGLMLTSGELIGIINADDWYVEDAIYMSVDRILKSGLDYTIGNVKKTPQNIIFAPIFPLESIIYQNMMYPHISAFIKKDVYIKIGLFDTQYKIAADFDMAMRIHQDNFSATYVDQVIANIHDGGISTTLKTIQEFTDIAIKYGKPPLLSYKDHYFYIIKFYIVKFLPSFLLNKLFKLKKSRFQFEEK